MSSLEKIVKEYSTKKIKEIVEQQYGSYGPNFIDYAKDELILRGEHLSLDEELIKDVAEMKDDDLKHLVEKEYGTYHLEYIEIARKEYLKRGFKNKIDAIDKETFEKRYPTLRAMAGFITFIAWLFAIISVLGIIIVVSNISKYDLTTAIIYLIAAFLIGTFFFAILLSLSEIIKVVVDIEENTRKYSKYYEKNEAANEEQA